MKKYYESPIAEIEKITIEDAIRTSGIYEGGEGGYVDDPEF
jgi:hypothetical protein